MTSLISLLVAASPDRHRTLARLWGMPVEGLTGSLAGHLFRRLSDDWYLRSQVERLPVEQLVVLSHIVGEGGTWARARLLRTVPLDEMRAVEAAAALVDLALLASDGPALSVPNDLLPLLRRLYEQRKEGRPAERGLRSMLNALALGSLQALGERWRVDAARTRQRQELASGLESFLRSPEIVDARLAQHASSARSLFRTIVDSGGMLGFPAAVQVAGSEEALHADYSALHALFLVHDGYCFREGNLSGQRVLYMPDGVASGTSTVPDRSSASVPSAAARPPADVILAANTLVDDVSRLLAYAQESSIAIRQRPDGLASLPLQVKRRLQAETAPRQVRLDYALRCAIQLGLLQALNGRWVLNAYAGEEWGRSSEDRRSIALFELWLSERQWLEPIATGHGRQTEQTAHLHHQARQRLPSLLAMLERGEWYALETLPPVAQHARARETGARSRVPLGIGRNADNALRVALHAALLAGFHWHGGVDVGLDTHGAPCSFRLTERGYRLAHRSGPGRRANRGILASGVDGGTI